MGGNHRDKWEKRRICCLRVAMTAAGINTLSAKWTFGFMALLQSSLTSQTTLNTSLQSHSLMGETASLDAH